MSVVPIRCVTDADWLTAGVSICAARENVRARKQTVRVNTRM
jgi:hypothetical protein